MAASSRKATLHDVAKRAHVSVASVSNYLNDYPYMKPATRERIQQAIDEGADCLVTGEAAHHIAILAKQKGVGLVVAGHWGTEHPVVFALADALTECLPKEVTVAPSLADVDPYSYL